MKNLWLDLRYALRQLRKNPAFTATAVLTLAIGIAATSTIFSWIHSTLLDPIPGAARSGDMVAIQVGERSEHPSPPFSYPDFVDLRRQAKSFSGLLGYHSDFMSITSTARPQRIFGEVVTAGYFDVLGVRPILGRSLLSTVENEHDGGAEAVLSYALWQDHFAGDPNIVGKTIEIDLHRFTIVGIAPPGFVGCTIGLRSDIWLPAGAVRQVWGWDSIDRRGTSWLNAIGVLRPGVSQQAALSELNTLMRHIVDSYPADHRGNNAISLDPLWRSPFGINVYLAGTLPILLALAGVLRLLACANVANLLLVRSVMRRRECAIRLAIGAGRWKLARQLLTENLLVAFAGGLAALAITCWTAPALALFLPSFTLPLNINGHVDLTVIAATVGVSLLTVVISGIVPALRASTLAPVTVLKDEGLSASSGIRKSRLTSALVAAQIALSLVLLVCAGLFVRSLQKAQNADPGFNPKNTFLVTYNLDPMGYTAARGIAFDRQVLDRVRALPGVRSATLADFSPLSFTIHSQGILPEGYIPLPHETIEVDRGVVSPGYLRTLGTPLLAGREFTDDDGSDSAPVAIVNQALADRYWPGQNAIGKHIADGYHTYTVVGVAANAKYRRLMKDPAPLMLLSLNQHYEEEVVLHVRVSGDPMAFAPAIDRSIHGLNSDLPLYNITTLERNMSIGNVFERIAVVLASSFGLLAMLLAAVGVYGVVSYTTRQRTHEIGIRMALGAGRADVFRQTLRQGLWLTLTGVGVGIAASLAFTRFLRGLLYGVAATDWLTFLAVTAALALVALAACIIPARRAASTEPMQALRTE